MSGDDRAVKEKGNYLRIRLHWLILLISTDIFFIFLVWIANPNALRSLVLIIILYTLLSVAAGYAADRVRDKGRIRAAEDYLERQGEYEEQELLAVTDQIWHASMRRAFELLREEHMLNSERQQALVSYQEFIEAWTHEIKTPLSLSELVIENHREEMSEYVYQRMQHVQHMVRLDVERILYYARLHAEHVDYKFERFSLAECAKEALTKFSGIAEEKKTDVRTKVEPVFVVSDRRALGFMLSQIYANAFKYTKRMGGIVMTDGWTEDGGIHLAVRDNGEGVPAQDIPFLFDKGFTGNHPGRQNATGMGLYFVKKYAKILGIEVQIEETASAEGGFGIELIFPVVTDLTAQMQLPETELKYKIEEKAIIK